MANVEIMAVVDGIEVFADVSKEGVANWNYTREFGWELDIEYDPEFVGFYILDEDDEPVDATDEQVVAATKKMIDSYWDTIIDRGPWEEM